MYAHALPHQVYKVVEAWNMPSIMATCFRVSICDKCVVGSACLIPGSKWALEGWLYRTVSTFSPCTVGGGWCRLDENKIIKNAFIVWLFNSWQFEMLTLFFKYHSSFFCSCFSSGLAGGGGHSDWAILTSIGSKKNRSWCKELHY